MENKYLDEKALKALIWKVMTGIDPECEEDQNVLYSILPSFHDYVDTVARGEMKLLLNSNVSMGQPYRDMAAQYDQARHSAHETAIINVRVLNRLADLYNLPPVFKGDSAERRQVAAFCMELDQYLFENRKMKLA